MIDFASVAEVEAAFDDVRAPYNVRLSTYWIVVR